MLHSLDLGLIDYEAALEIQLQSLERVHSEQSPGLLIFCQHPEVVTRGRASLPEDIQGWTGKTVDVSRGGKATYHGPSQLIVYPIFNLNFSQGNFPKRDLHWYLRNLERVVISVLEKYQVSATTNAPHTGVWVGDKKICSIGIAVKSWISYHGLALNLWDDPKAFQGISPCGFSKNIMTNLESELKGLPDRGVSEVPIEVPIEIDTVGPLLLPQKEINLHQLKEDFTQAFNSFF